MTHPLLITLINSILPIQQEKRAKENDEKYTNEVVAQAHVENYGMKIFFKADEDDRAGNATK